VTSRIIPGVKRTKSKRLQDEEEKEFFRKLLPRFIHEYMLLGKYVIVSFVRMKTFILFIKYALYLKKS
jgi:hypothetical protein